MKTETKHTPTPWAFDPEWGLDRYHIKAKKELIGKIEDRENAAFIVRAVNSHEELLKACRCLLVDLEYRKVETAGMSLARRVIAQAERSRGK